MAYSCRSHAKNTVPPQLQLLLPIYATTPNRGEILRKNQRLASTDWDTRTWILGISTSNALGLIYLYANLTSVGMGTKTSGFIFSKQAFNGLSMSATLISLFIVPAVLSAIARRRSLLWGFLPICTFFTYTLIESLLAGDVVTLQLDRWAVPVVGLASLILTSGSVSLVRLLLKPTAVTRVKEVSPMTSPSTPSEVVWPPPPVQPSNSP